MQANALMQDQFHTYIYFEKDLHFCHFESYSTLHFKLHIYTIYLIQRPVRLTNKRPGKKWKDEHGVCSVSFIILLGQYLNKHQV